MPSQDLSQHSQIEELFVGFAGHIGAGKTSAAHYLSTNYKFQYRRYSQVLDNWLNSEYSSGQGLQQFGWEVMAGGRQVELNARLIAQLDRSRSAAIDGLRHPIDFHSLAYAFGASFELVFIEAPAGTRFKRKPRFSTFDAFLAADTMPVEAHIDELRPLATTVVRNEASLESFYKRLECWVTSSKRRKRT